MCWLACNEVGWGWIGTLCVVWFYFNIDLNSGPREGACAAPLPKYCVGVSFELRRFSTPLLFSSELLVSRRFSTRELGIVVRSLTIRKNSLGAYPNCSCTQIKIHWHFHSDKRKLEDFNILVLFLVRACAERWHKCHTLCPAKMYMGEVLSELVLVKR